MPTWCTQAQADAPGRYECESSASSTPCAPAGPQHADGSPFNEEDWTDPSHKTVRPYVKSKVGRLQRAAAACCRRRYASQELPKQGHPAFNGPRKLL